MWELGKKWCGEQTKMLKIQGKNTTYKECPDTLCNGEQ